MLARVAAEVDARIVGADGATVSIVTDNGADALLVPPVPVAVAVTVWVSVTSTSVKPMVPDAVVAPLSVTVP